MDHGSTWDKKIGHPLKELRSLRLNCCDSLREFEIIGDCDLSDLKVCFTIKVCFYNDKTNHNCITMQLYCMNSLRSVRIEIPNSQSLKHLKIKHNHALSNLEIISNSLLSLDIRGCRSLSSENTHIECPNLQLLHLTGTSLDFGQIK